MCKEVAREFSLQTVLMIRQLFPKFLRLNLSTSENLWPIIRDLYYEKGGRQNGKIEGKGQ